MWMHFFTAALYRFSPAVSRCLGKLSASEGGGAAGTPSTKGLGSVPSWGDVLQSPLRFGLTVHMWAESGVPVPHSHSRSRGVREAVKVLASRREDRGVWPWGCGCGPELRWCWGVVGSEVTGFLGQ